MTELEGRRIGVVHSNPDYLVGLRLPLLRELVSRGAVVVGLAPRMTEEHVAALDAIGVVARPIKLRPQGLNPVRDLVDIYGLIVAFRSLALDVVICNTLKPVVYGVLSAAIAGVSARYSLISGLGFAFTETPGAATGLVRRVVRLTASAMYRASCRLSKKVIFQNSDDANEFIRHRICDERKAFVVNGSGVDLDQFSPRTSHKDGCRFIMVARVLREKGVLEYLEAARRTKRLWPDASFSLVGGTDENPGALTAEVIEPYVKDGVVEWHGHVADVRPHLAEATVFVLPSYREGVPRSTLEAMAMGLAIITTDAPGCKETVLMEQNGLIVPVKDIRKLSDAMARMASDPTRMREMGVRSRDIAKTRFDARKVSSDICNLI